MAGFATKLYVDVLDDGLYKLTAPLVYYSDILAKEIESPEDRETDFASVPRVPIVYWFYGNRAHHESAIHDELYRSGIVTRRTADRIFLEAMKSRGKGLFVRWGMYLGVRLGGWIAWRKYRAAEKNIS